MIALIDDVKTRRDSDRISAPLSYSHHFFSILHPREQRSNYPIISYRHNRANPQPISLPSAELTYRTQRHHRDGFLHLDTLLPAEAMKEPMRQNKLRLDQTFKP
ncbi:hypothetical protein COMA2_200016 [Candidatus Nitrospira nitrificans]|uniref:Uncharacterized protein n=1 Tax=Candidatus Nitrospira nitrificans TaxID=1742973 RepID=A0A0S4LH22_9BACT|nr:hypothetical protein COMA2_200016 [Candidatus Nitrospira nitrificans]